jgi:hypothetical protein
MLKTVQNGGFGKIVLINHFLTKVMENYDRKIIVGSSMQHHYDLTLWRAYYKVCYDSSCTLWFGSHIIVLLLICIKYHKNTSN